MAGQAGYVVERVLENREVGTNLMQQAVLFRTSHHSAALEIGLTRRNIPFVKFGGLKFLDTALERSALAGKIADRGAPRAHQRLLQSSACQAWQPDRAATAAHEHRSYTTVWTRSDPDQSLLCQTA